WTDLQIQLRDPVSQFVYNTNGSAAKSQGVELSVGIRPFRGFTASAWVDYDDAALTTPFPANSPTHGASGDRLPLSSRYSGNLSLEQSFPLAPKWVGFVGAQASYVGNRIGVFGAEPERQYFPAYTKTDLHAGVKDDSWTITTYVNNVGDTRALING